MEPASSVAALASTLRASLLALARTLKLLAGAGRSATCRGWKVRLRLGRARRLAARGRLLSRALMLLCGRAVEHGSPGIIVAPIGGSWMEAEFWPSAKVVAGRFKIERIQGARPVGRPMMGMLRRLRAHPGGAGRLIDDTIGGAGPLAALGGQQSWAQHLNSGVPPTHSQARGGVIKPSRT